MKHLLLILCIAALFCLSGCKLTRSSSGGAQASRPIAVTVQSRSNFISRLPKRAEVMIKEISGFVRSVQQAIKNPPKDDTAKVLNGVALGISGGLIIDKIWSLVDELERFGVRSDEWEAWMMAAVAIVGDAIASASDSEDRAFDLSQILANPFQNPSALTFDHSVLEKAPTPKAKPKAKAKQPAALVVSESLLVPRKKAKSASFEVGPNARRVVISVKGSQNSAHGFDVVTCTEAEAEKGLRGEPYQTIDTLSETKQKIVELQAELPAGNYRVFVRNRYNKFQPLRVDVSIFLK